MAHDLGAPLRCDGPVSGYGVEHGCPRHDDRRGELRGRPDRARGPAGTGVPDVDSVAEIVGEVSESAERPSRAGR